MNILEANDNILREAKYNLKLINGTNASIYPLFGLENKDLNKFGYWDDFIKTQDSLDIDIIKINSMEKSQSIWYTNTGLSDSIVLEVSNDYQTNIIEFLNRDLTNKNLDFDDLEDLIFIVEVTYINTVGWQTTNPIFTGRLDKYKYTNDMLKFTIKGLDEILKDTEFDVLKDPENSYFSNISLYDAVGNVMNTPHDKDDEYAYPVCPYIINESNYITDSLTDDKYVNETDILPSTYDAYAEDSVLGDENRKQVFFYRDSPECGIVDIKLDSNNNYESHTTFYMNEMRLFTNQQGVNFQDDFKILNDNMFRCFRPIRTFIAPHEETNYYTGSIQVPLGLVLGPSNTPEYRIDAGDEIILLEQLIEPLTSEFGSNTIGEIVFFNFTSNLYYYNKTKNIMYWNPIANQVLTSPLPSNYLDLRYEDYFGKTITWNNWYNYVQNNIFGRTFSGFQFIVNDSVSAIYSSRQRSQRCFVDPRNICGFDDKTNSPQTVGVNDEAPTSMIDKMDLLSKYHPKNIKINPDYKIIWNDSDVRGNVQGDVYHNVFIRDWSNPNTFRTEYIYDEGLYGLHFETGYKNINSLFKTVSLKYNIDNEGFYTYEEDYVKIGLNELGYEIDSSGFTGNFYLNDGASYYFENENLWKYDGTDPFIYKIYNDITILDVNVDEDIIIYKSNDNLILEELISGTLIDESEADVSYMLSTDRKTLNFYFNSTYSNYQTYADKPITILGYDGDRYDCITGIANSFFKNIYADNKGVKMIGFEQPNVIKLTQDDFTSITQDSIQYNIMEYDTQYVIKNGFEDVEDEEALEYDESVSLNMWSSKDVDLNVYLTRTSTGIEYKVSNDFGSSEGYFVPPDYSTFQFDLEDEFTGITIYVNLFGVEIEIGRSFNGHITRTEVSKSGVSDYIKDDNKKLIWRKDNLISLKFPFLFNKYSPIFNDTINDYFKDGTRLRKTMTLTIVVPKLLLFNDNYSVFNIGEQRIQIDSNQMYLNGYGFYQGSVVPYNDNRGSFFIQKATYNFNNHSTTLTLISI